MTAAHVVTALPVPARPPVPGVFRSGDKPLRLIRLTRVHACCATPGCAESIYSDGGQWRHARNDSYSCPSGAGWAEPYDPQDVDDLLDSERRDWEDESQASAEQAEQNGHDEGFEEGKQEGLDEGVEQGRKDMHAEIDAALNAAFDVVTIGPGATATDVERTLREALASAWNGIAP